MPITIPPRGWLAAVFALKRAVAALAAGLPTLR
jgi:hypothetical protein